MGQIICSSEDELAIDAIDLIIGTFDVVVLPYLIPRRKNLVTKIAESVRQLVIFVVCIQDHLSATWALDLQLLKNILN